MMISPEMYYEKNLKGKTVDKIMTAIRGLKREMGRLKKIIERPDANYKDSILSSPSEEVCLTCTRLYLERAKLALVEAGGVYIPSKAEKRAAEFDINIPFISKVEFCIGDFFNGYKTRSFIIEGDTVKTDMDGIMSSRDELEGFMGKEIDKESLFSQLADLHIGEWRRNYSPSRWGDEVLDGEQWHLYIYYSNGRKKLTIEGNNDYPYNFEELIKLFGVSDDKEDYIQDMVEECVEDLGATCCRQGAKWRGFQVYIPQYENNPYIGLPLVILQKGKEVRLSTPEEAEMYLQEEQQTKKYAIVKFIGDEEEYFIGKYCADEEWLFCNACQEAGNHRCNRPKIPMFVRNKEYKAYFLDYCQGVRDVLEVETEQGTVEAFIPLSDFEIVSDEFDVLNEKYAIVVCLNASSQEDLTEGKRYKALKKSEDRLYILDDSSDCYYYPKELFEIIEDKDGILNDNI